MSEETMKELKKDNRLTKFMNKHRYVYHRDKVTDLANLAYSFYLEGFNAGLGQHPLPPKTKD